MHLPLYDSQTIKLVEASVTTSRHTSNPSLDPADIHRDTPLIGEGGHSPRYYSHCNEDLERELRPEYNSTSKTSMERGTETQCNDGH